MKKNKYIIELIGAVMLMLCLIAGIFTKAHGQDLSQGRIFTRATLPTVIRVLSYDAFQSPADSVIQNLPFTIEVYP